MANIPCPNIINCPGSDSPIENYSAEAPDRLYFAGPGYTPFNPYQPPPVGDPKLFIARDCNNVEYSVESQEIADLIAAINAQNCQHPVTPTDPGPFDPKDPTYCNTPQTVSKTCPNGSTSSYTADAGLFCKSTQSAADQAALAYAQQQVAKIACPDIQCSISTSALPDGTVGTAYSTQVAGSLGTVSYWSVTSGSMPPGLSLNPLTGVISGTPTTAGTYTFTIGLREKSAAPQPPPPDTTPTTPSLTPTVSASVTGIALYVNAAHLIPGKNYSVSMELSAFGTDWYSWVLPTFTAVGTDYGDGVTWAYVDPTRFYGTYTTQGFVRKPGIIMVA